MEIKGLKIAFLGDSITEGVGASSPDAFYHSVLKEKCGLAEALNYGISGTRVSRQKKTYMDAVAWDRDFISRIPDIREDVDAVVIFGGTNDYDHGDAYLGSFSDRTEYTFYGALHILLESLIKKFPDKTIIYMTPLHRFDERDITTTKVYKGHTLFEYVTAIKEVCAYYSVPVLDLYATAGMNPCIPEQSELYFADGLHPNDKGYRRIAERLEAFFKSL